MKFKNLLAKSFAQRSNQNANVTIALIAGLAVGAVLAVLFAPESGGDVRRGIADKAKGFGDGLKDTYGSLKNRLRGEGEREDAENESESELPYVAHAAAKKPKSDIKELIHEAHNGEHNTN